MPKKIECTYCEGQGPERGFMWTDNNGPIVPCPFCNSAYDGPSARRQREFEAAKRQRCSQTQHERQP
jgi:hypothetical protein